MYFNDHEPYVAQWLRNLWPDATIDARSILDVQPADLMGHARCHFFAGIGGWQYALELAGWPEDEPIWSASLPCQPFSAAGRHDGLLDERHLWEPFRRLVAECRPPVIVGEQVASAAGRQWLAGVRTDLEALGYAVGAADLCAAGVGAPHIRQRLFWVAERRLEDTEQSRERRRGVQRPCEGAQENGERAPDQLERADAALGVADAKSSRGWAHAGAVSGGPIAWLRDAQGQDGRRTIERDGHVGNRGTTERPFWVADSEHAERRPLDEHRQDGRDGAHGGRQEAHGEPRACSEVLRLADTDRSTGVGGESRAEQRTRAADVWMGDAEWQRRRQDESRARQEGRVTAGGTSQGDDNPWRDAIWLPCLDGKARRTQSGLHPLAHGVPARVGRLRAYGNAIVPQVAAAFLMAYREARGG